ncbi:hypothetical protein J5N97_020416 [Dioscorea zingiberensis]|uniref:Uncharacterized protein n=1 Tax=Dioscorea zingiberensis TaxID=325984 RepID=A0A9D5CFT7_9LILI|nr:hypothetical protein J5N97_020416 [Dioscorea zingiberensis]
MGYSVTKLLESLIVPGQPTPSGRLSLSWIDRYPTHRGLVETLHVFQHGHQPALVIKRALSRVLVPYYPLAGRLVKSESDELEVDCTADGVLFIEAVANFTLEDVSYLELPLMISKDEILPSPLPKNEKAFHALVMMQVTQFKCGGFVIGLKSHHAVADGIGSAQFIKAVGEIARGSPHPVIQPVWCRETLLEVNKLKPGPPPSSKGMKELIYSTFDISNQHIKDLKIKFHEKMGRTCSTFDIMMAKVWKCRTSAIKSKLDKIHVHLTFAANTRQLLHNVIPDVKGYYGNCIFPVTVSASSEKVKSSSIIEIVNMIKDAKDELPTAYLKWFKGEVEKDPYQQMVDYNYLYASDWTNVGFTEVDYGWGFPMYIGPVTMSDCIASCVLLRSPVHKQCARLITRCVKSDDLDAFYDEMIMSLDS